MSQSKSDMSQLCQELSHSRPALVTALSRIAQNRATLGAVLTRVTSYFYSGAALSSVKKDLIRLWSSSESFPEFTLFLFWCALEVRYGRFQIYSNFPSNLFVFLAIPIKTIKFKVWELTKNRTELRSRLPTCS